MKMRVGLGWAAADKIRGGLLERESLCRLIEDSDKCR